MPLLLCDLDDTLIDRRSIYAEWAASYAVVHGRDEAFVDWLIDEDREGYRPREELWASIKERLELSESVDGLISGFRGSFIGFMRCTEAVVDALKRARDAGFVIAIVTNGDAFQQRKVDQAELAPLVDAVCISDLEGFRKPDRRIFETAARRCGATLESAWMIGDNPAADIGGAFACGVNAIWLANGRPWPAALGYEPNRIADSFEAAVGYVLGS